ncbi:ATP-binding protein [Cupriavidus sp. WGtm5]|uniref:ATP-binding protein n=1 Tax=Cupriavidus sp. WGtm5 TaxID=2919926 RepID=UPI0020911F12|nr:ATP-binding protein [Cupriavidus sp. WGtm5]MCO4887847.1 ATP-binding protein [Cupriavidus sp. WGtm5]
MYKRNPKFVHPELVHVLSTSKTRRLSWFENLNVSHSNLATALNDLLEYAQRGRNTRFIFLIGMTGVGKTSLAENALSTALTVLWEEEEIEIPFMYVPVETNDEPRFAWKNLYSAILEQGSSIPVESVREGVCSGDIMRFSNNKRYTLAALRKAIKRMAKERGLKVIIFDEAYYFLRFSSLDVMDTVKSFAEQIDVKLIFIGSYELLKLAAQYSIQIRRTEVVPFFRYDPKKKNEMREFMTVIEKFTSNWPCDHIPNFLAAADELAVASMGGVGQLSAILANFLGIQLRNKGEIWTPEMFGKALKATGLDEEMREQIREGEAELRRKYAIKNGFCTNQGIATIKEKLTS